MSEKTVMDIFPENKQKWLQEITDSVRLREGILGLTRSLWVLYDQQVTSTREWSIQVKIPVPVLAALRRELEKRNVLETGKSLRLTKTGLHLVESLFGKHERMRFLCPACLGTGRLFPPAAFKSLKKFESACQSRPSVDVTLDQSHATPETAIRKCLLLLEKGLLNQSILFLGDDDGISLSTHILRQDVYSTINAFGELYVLDIDDRYLKWLSDQSEGQIQTLKYDVRDELPEPLHNRFAVALTDPAYTENGITLFSYRCMEAMQTGGSLLLSMPFPDAAALRSIQQNLLTSGLAIQEILHQFNEYEGASLHGHHSSLVICEKVCSSPPDKSHFLRYTPLYTGEVRAPGGMYECVLCSTKHQVGPTQELKTIQDLKAAGCSECGHDSFRRIGGSK